MWEKCEKHFKQKLLLGTTTYCFSALQFCSAVWPKHLVFYVKQFLLQIHSNQSYRSNKAGRLREEDAIKFRGNICLKWTMPVNIIEYKFSIMRNFRRNKSLTKKSIYFNENKFGRLRVLQVPIPFQSNIFHFWRFVAVLISRKNLKNIKYF